MDIISEEKQNSLRLIDDSKFTGADNDSFDEIVQKLRTENYTSIELTYYCISLIERGELVEAKKFIDNLIVNGLKIYAGLLAEYLYDFDAPCPNDALWLEYFATASQDNEIYETEAVGSNIHDNDCGFWVPGHKSVELYVESFKNVYGFALDKKLVEYGYLEKKFDTWLFHKTKKEETLPITTCRNINVMRKAYPNTEFIEN